MVLDKAEKPVATASKGASIMDVASMMGEYNLGCIVITERDKPIGIVTDRDLALEFGQFNKDPANVKVESLMRKPLTTIEAGSSLMQIVQTMASANVRRLPVVDENDKLVDIVTMDDIVHLLAQTMGGLEDIIDSESPVGIAEFR
ncbi:MAG: CBS domain-containing protein [bacterium]